MMTPEARKRRQITMATHYEKCGTTMLLEAKKMAERHIADLEALRLLNELDLEMINKELKSRGV